MYKLNSWYSAIYIVLSMDTRLSMSLYVLWYVLWYLLSMDTRDTRLSMSILRCPTYLGTNPRVK